MKNVYMVQFDWSTTDANDVEIVLFADYGKAYNYFKQLISQELDPEMSWVGAEVFDVHGNVNEGYEFHACDESYGNSVYWHVVDKSDYYKHSFIDLLKKEIRQ